jgi:hypothetical protein
MTDVVEESTRSLVSVITARGGNGGNAASTGKQEVHADQFIRRFRAQVL